MTFGKWIRGMREDAGLTLEEVGKIVGMGKSSVSKLERGVIYGIHISRIRPLCQALKVTEGEMLDAWDKYGNAT